MNNEFNIKDVLEKEIDLIQACIEECLNIHFN